jgi:hypothetical protein
MLVRAFEKRAGKHAVLVHLPGFLAHVRARVYEQGKELGIVPAERPGFFTRFFAMIFGLLLFVRSQFARSTSKLEKIYISELGLDGSAGSPASGSFSDADCNDGDAKTHAVSDTPASLASATPSSRASA